MTRDDVLNAVSSALGARATAVVGFWNVLVETTPPREVVFTADWVTRCVEGADESAVVKLEERLRNASDEDWLMDPRSGLLIYIVR